MVFLVLGLWAPTQSLSGLGVTGLVSHSHELSVSHLGQTVLHHHELVFAWQDASQDAHCGQDGIRSLHSEGHNDHVIGPATPARSSSLYDDLVRLFAASQIALPPAFSVTTPVLTSGLTCKPTLLRSPLTNPDRSSVLLL